MTVQLKRIYEEKSEADGCRILVDRLWPRGIRKDAAEMDLWLRDIAPSPGLRRWFGHDPRKWVEFRRRYGDELKRNQAAVTELRRRVEAEKVVTLLYAARDSEHNHAVVLRDLLQNS
jgi:uncharacterized protein YeaO (DUF488 family)